MERRRASKLNDYLPKVMVAPRAVKRVAKQRKEPIPKAVREQTWLVYVGPQFKSKCLVTWCTNEINVFDFHTGHNIPEKEGGTLDISNLRPICARCNLSMGSTYTITEWSKLGSKQPPPAGKRHWLKRLFCGFNQ
jgi:5-methylcytosine-specific restriction endonuclease McrA